MPRVSSPPRETEEDCCREDASKQNGKDERGPAEEKSDQTKPVKGPDFGHLLYVHLLTDLIWMKFSLLGVTGCSGGVRAQYVRGARS
jgi:hypothetical protein